MSERFKFVANRPTPVGKFKAMTEAQFLAGEDATGVFVILEPETELGRPQVDALVARSATGVITDFAAHRFEEPDAIPTAAIAAAPEVLALAVSPRSGMRLRTHAHRGNFRVNLTEETREGEVEAVLSPVPPKRDRSHDPEIDGTMILEALGRLGVREGDMLLVHTSLSACGRIVGGTRTIVESLMTALGPGGNFFMPSFQRSECFLNGINKRWDHRPSDWRDRASESVRWVGSVPLEFMQLYPEAPRGRHLSHSWVGWGPQAAEVLAKQAEDESSFSDNSCPMVVKDLGGKILLFGSPVGHMSFVHCFETHFHTPGLGPSYYEVRQADGSITWRFVPNAQPGPREFYTKEENARFFREAIRRGLEIRREPLGVGELKLIDCRQFWDIGSELVRADPGIILGRLPATGSFARHEQN